jgi:oxygen-independent coproporphyrinogen-3 oxidase
LANIAALFGRSPAIFDDSLRGLCALEAEGMVRISGGKVVIKPDRRQAARLVCAAFDQYLSIAPARHSVSV